MERMGFRSRHLLVWQLGFRILLANRPALKCCKLIPIGMDLMVSLLSSLLSWNGEPAEHERMHPSCLRAYQKALHGQNLSPSPFERSSTKDVWWLRVLDCLFYRQTCEKYLRDQRHELNGVSRNLDFMASRAANNTFNVYVDDKPVEVDGSYTVY